jgi:Nitrate and nitrite sensing
MSLSRSDAVRILRFCLAADDSGTVSQREDGTCVVTIALCRSSYEVHTFEDATFEESLRRAGAAGALKAECVDKQIAFMARRDPSGEGLVERTITPLSAPAVTLPANDTESPFLMLAGGINALVHETQRERGASTLFVASCGKLFGDQLPRQWVRTDQQLAALNELLRAAAEPSPPSVRRRLDRAYALLGQIGRTRAGVEDRVVAVAQVITLYSAINLELLSALDAFLVAGAGGPPCSGALACVALLYAKEKTGIERAQLAETFLNDRFGEGQRLSVAALIAAQTSYLHIFSSAAPRAAEQLLRRTLASPAACEVQRMESVVYAANDAGFGIDASTWFTMITRKIDMLGDVSSTVIKMLREQR